MCLTSSGKLVAWIAGMRTVVLFAGLALWVACAAEPSEVPEPPSLTVASPERALVREQAGALTVTGNAVPGASGARVAEVTVNGVVARLSDDGSFTAQLELAPGATFVQTVARDVAGGEASDTRTVHAGELRDGGALVEHGLAVALSDDALARLASAAGALMKTTDLAPILAPQNPMVSQGAEAGEDCLWGKVYVDDVNLGDARLALAPTAAGLALELEVTALDVPARARYAALCLEGSTSVRMRASKLLVRGVLRVTPRANRAGLDVRLVAPQVTVAGFQLTASGLPGDVLELLALDSAIGSILGRAAEIFLGPLLETALGGLAGPKQVMVAGQPVGFELAAEAVSFDVTGAKVALASRMGLARHPARFVYTPNQPASLEAATGYALAISDDALNQLLASVTSAGLLSFTMPAPGGTFESVRISAAMPPMISAEGHSGKLRILAGELRMALVSGGAEVAHVALHLAAEVSAEPTVFGVRLLMGPPEVHADVLDNVTGYGDADKEQLIKLVVEHQSKTLSLLLGNVPLPSFAGVTLAETRVRAADGFVQVTGALR